MSFTKAFLTGLKGIVEAGNDLDRLKFLPQKVEDGHIINFNGKSLIGKVEGLQDVEIFDAEEVLTKKRLTGAFISKYMNELDKFIDGFEDAVVNETTTEETKEDKIDPILEELLDFAKKGDKKGARTVLKELKNKWFALDDDIVEDAIEDIKDAIADKDVDEVEKIYNDTQNEGEEVEAKPETVVDREDAVDEEIDEASNDDELQSLIDNEKDDDIKDLLMDIQDAINDEDKDDITKILLPELLDKDDKHPAVKLVNQYLDNEVAADEEEPTTTEDTKEDDDLSDEEWINQWCDDADKALDNKDAEELKVLLEEFKEEFGDEEDEYKEYSEKYEALVNPPKTTRTRRRGRK